MFTDVNVDQIKRDEVSEVKNFLERQGLTKNQIKRIVGDKKKLYYTKDEICTALVLHSVSPKSYEIMRKNSMMLTPLPHPSTLRRRIKGFICAPGIQSELFKLLELKLSSEEDAAKQAIVVFDEMAVRECFEYCNRLKRAFGNHKKVQVVMIREKYQQIYI